MSHEKRKWPFFYLAGFPKTKMQPVGRPYSLTNAELTELAKWVREYVRKHAQPKRTPRQALEKANQLLHLNARKLFQKEVTAAEHRELQPGVLFRRQTDILPPTTSVARGKSECTDETKEDPEENDKTQTKTQTLETEKSEAEISFETYILRAPAPILFGNKLPQNLSNSTRFSKKNPPEKACPVRKLSCLLSIY